MTRRAIQGCRAIVTGASSGIGRALALELAHGGAQVVATARRAERLAALAEQAAAGGHAIETVHGDITWPATRAALLARARERFGGLDLLVNNAGAGAIQDFAQSDERTLRQVMEVNFFAPVEMIREAMPLLRAGRRPMIINVASILGHRGVPHYTEYCASKFALVGFSESLRAELYDAGIDVLVVSPGTTQSEFFDALVADQPGVGRRGETGVPVDRVARAVVRAIRRGRHEIVPNSEGRLLLWLNRLSPRLADALVRRFG
ncbi:MAG: SDR family NAD(P)-dependent oxidoreductase [Planctomycetia bacterium]|nr:SDR family NAD(P)-dependent oxidoreductase [Planctomycetia bacterium]